MSNFQEKSNFIWKLENLLRESYKRNEYQNVILPLTVLKRLDSLLQYSKQDILDTYSEYNDKIDDIQSILFDIAVDEEGNKLGFYNFSKYDLNSLLNDEGKIEENMIHFIEGFSDNIKDIFYNFDFKRQVIKLSKKDILYSLIKEIENLDLSPKTVSNYEMGIIFEELVQKFAETTYFRKGEYPTPRDVVKLLTELVLIEDSTPNEKGLIKRIYDPACGTGGMLTCCKDLITKNKKGIDVQLYGQEINPKSYAISKARMLLRGEKDKNIKGPSSTLSDDQFKDDKFDYIISNMPYGRNWESDKEVVEAEVEQGFNGRFGAGTPRRNDGQFLFMQHMISKMKIGDKSKIAVITNGSPLFVGDAGSGESNIRKWIFENDYLEALIALPNQLFFNTGIVTYIWILTNKKTEERKGKVQLIDAREECTVMKKGSGNKRNQITNKSIKKILSSYNSFKESDKVKIFDNEDFGYKKITIERPLQHTHHEDTEDYVTDENGNFKADPKLREYKKVPLNQNIQDYLEKNIFPYYKDAWIDESRTKIGYKINFNRLIFDEKLYFDDIDCPIAYLDELITFNSNNNEYDLYVKRAVNSDKVFFYPNEIPDERKNSQYTIGCNIKSERILKDYLYCYFNSKKGLKHAFYMQTAFPIWSRESILEMPIPLPDINTQKEIAETYRLIDGFFNDINIWRNDYLNNVLNYKPALKTYKELSCSIKFSDDEGVSDFCHNWRIVYQGLIWPLAYTYLKATKGSKEESTIKSNLLVLFEFLASFNVIVLISGINNSDLEDDELEDIKKSLWALRKNDPTTWHRMAFGSWTKLYDNLNKSFKNHDIIASLDKEFFNKLSSKKYVKLFNKLRHKERNADAHSGLEDDIDVETKLEDLKKYVDTDVFEILNIYSGLKLYYISNEIKRISPKKISHKVLDLNGPCDPQYWPNKIYHKELDPHCLYLYDPLTNSYLKLDDDLIKFRQIPGSKQFGIYIYDGIVRSKNKNVAKYKCYQRKNEYWEVDLFTDEDTYFKVSEEFVKDVLRL